MKIYCYALYCDNVSSYCFKENCYLFVHKDVDNWVVNCGCFGEESRDGGRPGVKLNSGISCDQYGEGCIRGPTHHERHNHHHNHTGHLPLRLSGSCQTTMRYLKETETINALMNHVTKRVVCFSFCRKSQFLAFSWSYTKYQHL